MNIMTNLKNSMNKQENVSDQDEEPSFKRIAMISTHGYIAAEPPLGAPDTGGQVVYVLELSKVLAKLGYRVDIYTRQFEEQEASEEVSENVKIIRIPCGGKDFVPKEYMVDVIDEWVKNAHAYILSNKIEYLFFNSHYWDAGIAGQCLSEMMDIPHIHTPHSLGTWKKQNMETDYPENTSSFETKYNFTQRIETEKELYKKCYRIIATTPIQEGRLVKEYKLSSKQISMIPPGYDDNKFFPMADASKSMLKEKYNFGDNCILALSRLANNKGLDLLLEAFALVLKDVNAQLVLAIGHEERSELEQKIYEELLDIVNKNNMKDKVHFVGFIPDEEIADVYRASDMFVLSSRYEPFGMTAVEAMACGTPTIVTKHGGLCRVLEDGSSAIVSDPFKTEKFAQDISVILRHEGLAANLAAEGSRVARENFSWTEIGMKLVSLVSTEIK